MLYVEIENKKYDLSSIFLSSKVRCESLYGRTKSILELLLYFWGFFISVS